MGRSDMHDLIFDESFKVIGHNGIEEKFNYFLLNNVPVIDYSRGLRSVCGKIPLTQWKHYDGLIPNGTPAIFLKVEQDHDLNFCSLYHELGHIELGHLDEELHDERLDGVQIGIVIKAELEADAYASKFVGTEKIIKWLTFLLNMTQNKIYYFEFMEQKRETGLCEEEKEHLDIWKKSNQEIKLRIAAINKSG
ncbi:hypothetical protein NST33_17910 [Paenibacillus sp. FSL L8-0435]|uniref:hypothetical protein n=1 Tax=Paenibacillus sp. FSL L8-0435 TaxID=2954618 RepID=UPI0030DDCE79